MTLHCFWRTCLWTGCCVLFVASLSVPPVRPLPVTQDEASQKVSQSLLKGEVMLSQAKPELSTLAHLYPGPWRLLITFGEGGLTNEGYPGWPPPPHSPYQGRRANVRVLIGDRQIAYFLLPPFAKETGQLRQAEVPFICFEGGGRTIRLVAELWPGDDLEVKQMVLAPLTSAPAVPHTLQQSWPAPPLMDLISWCEYVFYTLPPGHGPDDIRDKVLRPSWKAGFNMIWTTFNSPGGTESYPMGAIPIPWDEQATGMPMPATYAWSGDKRWQVEGYRRYLDYVHDRNMMEMFYYPGRFPGLPIEISLPGQNASVVRTADKILNSLLYDWRGLTDGISNERYCATNPDDPSTRRGSRELALAHVNQLLESNPGAFAVNYISGVDSARPGMVGDMPNGLEPYSAGYFESFDDALMVAPDPWWLRVAGGKKYRWIEFWTEDGELIPDNLRKAPPTDAGNIVPQYSSWYSGHIGEDFIVKQMNDVTRRRLLDPSRYDALTGVTWYTDGMIVSDTNYAMAYAVSQDPVRAALAGQLRTLGQGGRVRSLYPYPTNSYFLQNNYLALFLPPGKAGGELFYDWQRTANYTPASFSVPLARNFLGSSMPGGALTTATSTVLERGGFRAVVSSELTFESGQTEVKETRRLELTSDTPYVLVTIEDRVKGPNVSLSADFGGEHYAQLEVSGKVNRESTRIAAPQVAVLRDSSGLRPDLVLLMLDSPAECTLDWEPGKGWSITRPAARPLRVALVVPTDLYSQKQMPALAQELAQPAQQITWTEKPMGIKNPTRLPITKVIALKGVDDRPYLVKEGNWWTFRGAQVSKQQERTDFLKVYLPAQGQAVVIPWGFIDGLVRPGSGCQYILAIGNVQQTDVGTRCKAKVLTETPLIFAPRVEFAWPVAEVRVNGQPWYYFEGSQVFLPQPQGEYEIWVRKGEPHVPHISRTFASIESMNWKNNKLVFQASAPPWRPVLPEGYRLTAQIEHPGRQIVGLEGGKVLKQHGNRSIITVTPGPMRISFR